MGNTLLSFLPIVGGSGITGGGGEGGRVMTGAVIVEPVPQVQSPSHTGQISSKSSSSSSSCIDSLDMDGILAGGCGGEGNGIGFGSGFAIGKIISDFFLVVGGGGINVLPALMAAIALGAGFFFAFKQDLQK